MRQQEVIKKKELCVYLRLFNSKMCIYTSISCSACQVFVLSVWNVLLTSTVAELFRQTKVNDVELKRTKQNKMMHQIYR